MPPRRIPFPDNPQRTPLTGDRRMASISQRIADARVYVSPVVYLTQLVGDQLMPVGGPLRNRPQVRAPYGNAPADNTVLQRAKLGM